MEIVTFDFLSFIIPHSDMDLPAVGTRIYVAGSLGTVKFAGSVDNTKGVWLGVEWDDPDRGKHSGTKDGKHYFECRCV
jgi:dynactin complex subunit